MTPDAKAAYARSFPVHVGVDTAKQFHVLVALGPDGRRTPPFTVRVSRAGFEAAHAHLQQLFPQLTPAEMLVGRSSPATTASPSPGSSPPRATRW